MYNLERGSRKYKCPGCGAAKRFKRYIDQTGNYLDETAGRCDRESSCGYHLTPKEFLSVRSVQCSIPGELSGLNKMNQMSGLNTLNTLNRLNRLNAVNTTERIEHDIIDNSFVLRSLDYTERNNFINYLLTFIGPEHVSEAVKKYFLGTTKDGKSCFWMIDQKGKARTGKIIAYDPETGKRDKSVNPSWIHYELKKHKLIPETFEHKLCFFGEHLLRTEKQKPIAIVEAEKTAVIASMFLPEYVWLAIGGKSYLKAEKLARFRNRKIVLFPDADGFELWSREAAEAKKMRLDVSVSLAIEQVASDEEKAKGFDLADYLILTEQSVQTWNERADAYNDRWQSVLEDADCREYFDELIDERLAIMELSEMDITEDMVRTAVEYAA